MEGSFGVRAMKDPLVEVGRVAGSHGVTGKVRVKPYSGDPSGLLGVRAVRLSAEGPGREKRTRDFEVKAAEPQGGFAVFSLGGIDSREEAKVWSGASVSVSRAELPSPAEGEYYWVDLIGCEVMDESGGRIGEIAGLEEGAAHDWLAIRREGGESLLPMVSEFIREIDIRNRLIVVAPPDGW